jgi:hypothetical protein
MMKILKLLIKVNKNQQLDSANVSPFMQKDAQKAPSSLETLGYPIMSAVFK